MSVPIVVYKDKLKQNSWARWMCGRTMRKNNNNLVVIVGKTGSGKTYAGLSICEIMAAIDGVPFHINHVVFSLLELMELLNSGNLKRGDKVLFDEPQASISAREFQSEANKVFNLLVSTFRHRNLTLIFCTPFESLLDKNTRKLFHVKITTHSINPKEKTCRLLPRFIEYSDYKVEPYRKKLVVRLIDTKTHKAKNSKLDYWDIRLPSKELRDQYEAKKLEFTTRLNKNIMARLKKFDEAGKSMTSEIDDTVERKPLTARQEEVMRVLSKHDYAEASKILGINFSSIHGNKKLAMNKGYTLEEFKDNE